MCRLRYPTYKVKYPPKNTLSGNPFFQPLCALALLLCVWRLFRALGCGGVGEVGYMVELRCGAVASALLRLSRDTAEALSELFLAAPCALSEGRAHSLGLLQYSQHCHRSLIRARCGSLRIHGFRGYHECKIRVLCRYSMHLLKYHIKCSSEEMALTE